MTVAGLLHRAAGPLDAVRRSAFRITLKSPSLRALLLKRDRRLAALATTQAVVALVLAICFPTALLVIGPVAFGVLHVAADVRYLVLRRGLASWWRTAIWGFCAVLFAVRALSLTGLVRFHADRAEFFVTGAFMLVACLAGALESGRLLRALLAVLTIVCGTTVALLHPNAARLVYAHAHNFVAVALWAALFRARLSTLFWPLSVALVGFGVLASGALSGFTLELGYLRAFGLHLFEAVDWMAPALPTYLGVGLICAFVFAQSLHYAVWLTLIPQDDTKGEGIQSFRLSARSLLADFGALGIACIALLALAVIAGALFDARMARNTYLSLAMFHGYLELALFAYFGCRGAFAPRQLRITTSRA